MTGPGKFEGTLIGPPVGKNEQPKPTEGCIYRRMLSPEVMKELLQLDRIEYGKKPELQMANMKTLHGRGSTKLLTLHKMD